MSKQTISGDTREDSHLAENIDGRECLKSHGVPHHGFRVGLNHKFQKKGKAFKTPRLHQIPAFIGLSVRYMRKWNKVRKQGKKMFIDIRDGENPLQQIYGVPLGGIGCGSIGRGFRGEFGRFQMIPGMYKWKTIPGDQFIVTIRKDDQTVYQHVLSSVKAPKKHLSAWQWEFPGDDATYHGLYPRSWTIFRIPEFNITLICRQISPIIAHDYQESSLPTSVFVWEIKNNSDDNLDISITFTFQNGIGRQKIDCAGGVWNSGFDLGEREGTGKTVGVSINQKLKDMNCSYLIAAKCQDDTSITRCLHFDPEGSGKEIWNQLLSTGSLKQLDTDKSEPTQPMQKTAVALCVKTTVEKLSQKEVQFNLSWHMPDIQFGGGQSAYKRRYARWFYGDNAGPALCMHSLSHYPEWERRIDEWQNPILNSSLPSWYKSAIFNELYFVADGGTVWLDPIDQNHSANQLVNDYGKFAYLEGHEYRMYNTYDVHFYASFALIMNWPKLQLSLQHDMAHAIQSSIPEEISYIMDGKTGPIKEKHCVPHDIGDPEDEPWRNINSYSIHPTADWKDLNPKFVLQVMRDYHVTKDRDYLADMFPTVQAVLEKSMEFDTDDDGMIENGGYADQTYDTWTCTGASAYCGSLWIAALRVTVEMCKILENDKLDHYQQLLNRAAKAFDQKLWNGQYYNYDSSKSSHHTHIMSDQLCGLWYLKSCGIEDENVFPHQKVLSALETIYENNVSRFGGGLMGAINGCKPDGSPDRTTVQSEEFWTGVSYALSASFLQEGMLKQAFQTSYGVYKEVYELRGLAFQTPEAYMDNEVYRSLGYMRPLSIWSIQWAIEQYHPDLLNGMTVHDKMLSSTLNGGIQSEAGTSNGDAAKAE